MAGATLFGVSSGGGAAGNGTVFKLNSDGTGFTNLYMFQATDGATPDAALISTQKAISR